MLKLSSNLERLQTNEVFIFICGVKEMNDIDIRCDFGKTNWEQFRGITVEEFEQKLETGEIKIIFT